MKHSLGSYSVLGRYQKDGIMDIRTGTGYVDLVETALDTDGWYEIWLVVSHAANRYSQYIKGGSDFPEQTLVYENAAYRFATFADLQTLMFATATGTESFVVGKDPIYFDDFHIVIGEEILNSLPATVADILPLTTLSVGEAAGSSTITLTASLAADNLEGLVVFNAVGTELGVIESIVGNILTFNTKAGQTVILPSDFFSVNYRLVIP